MPRTKVSQEQKKKSMQKAVNKFHREKMKVFTFRFHKENQRDVIEHLESQENKAGYIADLIRKDLVAQGKQPFTRERVCDIVANANEETTITLVFKDNSKMVAGKEIFEQDERLVDRFDYKAETNELIIYVRYS